MIANLLGARASPRPPSTRSTKSEVGLIPWDPDSPEHIDRMIQQRIACGWKQELVESWRPLQKEGKIALQWVVFTDSDPDKDSKLEEHVAAYPGEANPLVDSATSLGGKPWEASRKCFIPVGHISLDNEYEKPGWGENGPGIYWIATFYISGVLQGYGLGRAAMDTVEHMAISEPLNAKTLALSTAANEYKGMIDKWEAMGRPAAKVSLQDWYARRGYEVYKYVDEMWSETDPTGKLWPVRAVFMRKDIK